MANNFVIITKNVAEESKKQTNKKYAANGKCNTSSSLRRLFFSSRVCTWAKKNKKVHRRQQRSKRVRDHTERRRERIIFQITAHFCRKSRRCNLRIFNEFFNVFFSLWCLNERWYSTRFLIFSPVLVQLFQPCSFFCSLFFFFIL